MPQIQFKSEGDSFDVEAGQSFLEISDSHDTPLIFGCMEGQCGTCKIKVYENPQNISKMEEKEKEFLESIDASKNERLGCQCKVLGDVVIDVADFGDDSIFD